MNNIKWDFVCSISELESLGLQIPKLNELNDSYEIVTVNVVPYFWA